MGSKYYDPATGAALTGFKVDVQIVMSPEACYAYITHFNDECTPGSVSTRVRDDFFAQFYDRQSKGKTK